MAAGNGEARKGAAKNETKEEQKKKKGTKAEAWLPEELGRRLKVALG